MARLRLLSRAVAEAEETIASGLINRSVVVIGTVAAAAVTHTRPLRAHPLGWIYCRDLEPVFKRARGRVRRYDERGR